MMSFTDSVRPGDMAQNRKTFPLPIWIGLLTLLALTGISSATLLVVLLRTHSRHFAPVLFQDLVKNYDLLCFRDRFRSFGTADFYALHGQSFNYPAPVALLLDLLYRLQNPNYGYKIIAFLFELSAAVLFVLACMRRRVSFPAAALVTASFLVFSFPHLLMLYLSNLELFVWIVLSLGVWAWWTKRSWLAVICFGIAGSFKYFPLLFLGLYAFPREWKKIAAGLLAFFLVLFSSLWLLGPTVKVAALGLKSQMAPFTTYYLYDWHPVESGIDHSLFGFIKLVLASSHHLSWLPHLLPLYLFAAGIFLLLVYFLRIAALPDAPRLVVLSVLAIWITPLSHDYTLVNLYPAFAVLILYTLDRKLMDDRKNILRAIFACFGVIFADLGFVQFHGERYGGQIRCILLGILLVLVLRSPWQSVFAADCTPHQATA